MPGRSRGYTTLLAVFSVIVLAASWGPARSARAQIDVSIDPVLTKGASDARITIF